MLDALLLPRGGRTSFLETRDRNALANFASRAAFADAELEVWGGAQSPWETDEAARAGEIALLALALGGLPQGRAQAMSSLWPLASGAGVVVLLVTPAGTSP